MFKVSCPHCGVRLTAPDELLGKPVNCQKCNTKFILSNRWMNEPMNFESETRISDSPLTGTVQSSSSKLLGSAEETGERQLRIEIENSTSEEGSLIAPAVESKHALPAQNASTEFSPAIATIPGFEWNHRLTANLNHVNETYSILALFDFRFRYFLTPSIVRLTWFLAIILFAVWLFLICYFYVSSLLNQSPTLFPASALSKEKSVIVQGDLPTDKSVWPMLLNLGFFITLGIMSLIVLLWVRILLETMMMVFCIGGSLKQKSDESKRINSLSQKGADT